MKKMFVLSLSIVLSSFVFSQTIDVLIKGMDDGIQTNKQQDYAEACMNAKLQAIERAGVEIQSITEVVNFQVKYDMVESKAKAVLLPGFQIMDMGYQTDGSYQVVLSGKVKSGQVPQQETEEQKMTALKKDINGPWELNISGETEKRFIVFEQDDSSIKFYIQNESFYGKFKEGKIDISGSIGNWSYTFNGAITSDGKRIVGSYEKSDILYAPLDYIKGTFQMIRQ